jgi:WD40 repeat protein
LSTAVVVKTIQTGAVDSLVTLSNNNLASVCHPGFENVQCWNTSTLATDSDDQQQPDVLYFPFAGASCLLALPNERLVVGNDHGRIGLLNATNGELVKEIAAEKDEDADFIESLLLLNESTIASGSSRGEICIIDLIGGDVVRRLEGHTDRVTLMTLFKNGHMASASFTPDNKSNIHVWDWQSGRLISSLPVHRDSIYILALKKSGFFVKTRFLIGDTWVTKADGFTCHLIEIWNVKS